jgi:hypothetical protein
MLALLTSVRSAASKTSEVIVTPEILEATDDGWLKPLVLENVITDYDYACNRIRPGTSASKSNEQAGR